MKHKFLALFSASLLVLGLAGCDAPRAPGDTGSESAELMIFAAASMTETLTELGELYMEENKNATVSFNFDSSGTLKTQIEEGALCDVFISAGQKQMDQLDLAAGAEKNPDGLDRVLQGSRIDLLENKVVLAVPKDNPADIRTFQDLKYALDNKSILLSMGRWDSIPKRSWLGWSWTKLHWPMEESSPTDPTSRKSSPTSKKLR
jgi:molybdate transport system substrate-binding protein